MDSMMLLSESPPGIGPGVPGALAGPPSLLGSSPDLESLDRLDYFQRLEQDDEEENQVLINYFGAQSATSAVPAQPATMPAIPLYTGSSPSSLASLTSAPTMQPLQPLATSPRSAQLFTVTNPQSHKPETPQLGSIAIAIPPQVSLPPPPNGMAPYVGFGTAAPPVSIAVPASGSSGPNPKKRRRVEISKSLDNWELYNNPSMEWFSLYNTQQLDITKNINLVVKLSSKNIQYSASDDAFILYKQNQFEVCCTLVGLPPADLEPPSPGSPLPLFVEVGESLHPVDSLYVDIYAVSQPRSELLASHGAATALFDRTETRVKLLKLGASRTKGTSTTPTPRPVVRGAAALSKLQFDSSTPNNARLHPDQPNPNQAYYRLVILLAAAVSGLAAAGTASGSSSTSSADSAEGPALFPILAKVSPPLIVRGQNPGRYAAHHGGGSANERQSAAGGNNGNHGHPNTSTPNHTNKYHNATNHNAGWRTAEAAPADQSAASGGRVVYTDARVGIGTAAPKEALEVRGNILVTGAVVKPSDARIKSHITPVDTKTQLDRIRKIKLYDYDVALPYPNYGTVDADTAATAPRHERGVLAQELRDVIPEAVEEISDFPIEFAKPKSAKSKKSARTAKSRNRNAGAADGSVDRASSDKTADHNDIDNATENDSNSDSDAEDAISVDVGDVGVPRLLVVNDRVLLIENLGATQQLSRDLLSLDNRVGRVEEETMEDRRLLQTQQAQLSKLQALVDFISSESESSVSTAGRSGVDDGDSRGRTRRRADEEVDAMCYCSCFGLGPAWTMFFIGFFFVIPWIIGARFICHPQRVRRVAGWLNLTMFSIWVIVTVLTNVVFHFKAMSMLWVMLGCLVMGTTFILLIGYKMMQKRKAMKEALGRWRLRIRKKLERHSSQTLSNEEAGVHPAGEASPVPVAAAAH